MGAGSSTPAEPVKTNGETITTAKIFGRTRSIFMIIMLTIVMLALGSMIIKMSSQSGQSGAMSCMVLFGLLLAFAGYYFMNIDNVEIITTTTSRGFLGIPSTKKETNKGEIYLTYEFTISAMAAFSLLLFLSFNQYNKPSGRPQSAPARTSFWKKK